MSDFFWSSMNCYGQPSSTIMSGTCDREGAGGAWVKYDCYVSHFRSSADKEEKTSINMDVNVAVAVLLIVAVIGMIGGFLVYRKRKKSAQLKMLLDDDNHASEVAA